VNSFMAAVTLLALSLLHVCSSVPVSRPTNWLRQCRASANISITALEVLPGGGWDNLRNMDMGRVMNLSYFECQTTEDGLYLIPDEVFVIPHKETGVETNSEIISSWLEQKSSTSNSINADVSFLKMLNGKFSVENQRMKTHQVKDSSTTARVQVRNLIYTVKAYPDFTLDTRFAQQAKAIADAIENNQTRNADYLSEKMVLDYGTHVITSVDARATLVEETTSAPRMCLTVLQTHPTELITSEISVQYSVLSYPKQWRHTFLSWHHSAEVAGKYPKQPGSYYRKVAFTVSQAIDRYYKVNTRPGCVDINSKNFNFQANIDDSSCEGPATNLSFGGVYQECVQMSSDAGPLCDALAQKNLETGEFSCRSPYISTLLRSEVRQQGYTSYDCYDQRYRCGFLGLSHCHRQVCQDNYHVRTARINTYWCSVNGTAPDNSGYLFGGIYSPSLLNPLTNAKSCPQNFIPVKFLSDGQMICVSKDYETGTRFSVPFGGLFSCQSGNPISGSQHLSDGCEILYCVQSGLFTGGQLLPIHLPPFNKPPLVSMQATNTVMVMTEGDTSWVRVGETKAWKVASPQEIKKIMQKLNPELYEMSSGEKTGVANRGEAESLVQQDEA
uniref:Macrophage-expressed gene 1 protein n=1 Tax=Labrus bergylta TaxID=56723 RepID=A0A3Q3F531_9LABR